MNKYRILFIIYDLERGGPEMRLLNFAKYFADDIELFICVTSNNISMYTEFAETKAKIIILPIAKPYAELSNVLKITNYIESNNIDLVNVFDLKGLIICSMLKLMLINIPVVYHNVNSLVQYVRLSEKVLFNILIKLCCSSICNSEFSKRELVSRLNENKINVIYNGVDVAKFVANNISRSDIREQYGIKDTDILIGCIGNFRKQKNHIFLINAFKRLKEINSNYKLVCVGGGRYLDDINAVVRNEGLFNDIFITGYTDRVADYLGAIDVFVLPSTYEGFPNVILEAMSAGKPVIASEVGGCPELIQNSVNGILYESNNFDQFISAVEQVVHNEKLRNMLIENAHRRLTEMFTLPKMIEAYATYFRQLIDHKAN